MGKRTFSFPICPFPLSHHASYPSVWGEQPNSAVVPSD